MASLITVELKALRFHAFHGLYAEERKAGNEFEVNLAVTFETRESVITELDHTINYVKIYDLLKQEMKQHRNLLETFVMELAEKIKASFPEVKKIEISINKLQPPIIHFTGSVGVKYVKEF